MIAAGILVVTACIVITATIFISARSFVVNVAVTWGKIMLNITITAQR